MPAVGAMKTFDAAPTILRLLGFLFPLIPMILSYTRSRLHFRKANTSSRFDYSREWRVFKGIKLAKKKCSEEDSNRIILVNIA